MDDNLFIITDNWKDWLAVFGYIAFIVFIVWRVFASK
jgi:hypothetical protein